MTRTPVKLNLFFIFLVIVTVFVAGCGDTPVHRPNMADTSMPSITEEPTLSGPVVSSGVINVSSVSIDPRGAIPPGTPVTVSFLVNATGFPASDDLEFSTDLDKPKWTYTIVVNGVELPRPAEVSKNFTMVGFEISYLRKPLPIVLVKMTLEGTAPVVNQTMNKTIFRVTELNTPGNQIRSSLVERTTTILEPTSCCSPLQNAETELQVLRADIDAKAALGFDTSVAEWKYNQAAELIDAAIRTSPSEELTVRYALEDARAAIADAHRILDALV